MKNKRDSLIRNASAEVQEHPNTQVGVPIWVAQRPMTDFTVWAIHKSIANFSYLIR